MNNFSLLEVIKHYSFWERFHYTRKGNWFVKKYFLLWRVPHVASDFDIHIDIIWRDIQVKNKKQKALNDLKKI